MKQVGFRQEAARLGGIGSCGRELCCSTWLTDFRSVNTSAARYQQLSLNPQKLAGQCGKLKCCLNYELDTYLDALQGFPDNCDVLQVAKGNAFLIKKDIFKNLMWYTLPDSNKQYPLSIERVQQIKSLNQQGIRPDELEPVEVTSSKPKEAEPEFVELVGQISLRSLDKAAEKKRRQNQPGNQSGGQRGQRPQQKQQGQGGNQSGGSGGQQGGRQHRNLPGGQSGQGGGRQGGNQQRQQQRQQCGGQQGGINQQRPNNPGRKGGNPNRNQQRPNNPNRNQQRPDNPNQGQDKQ